MTRYILSEEILGAVGTLRWIYYTSLDDAMQKMYNKFLKYILHRKSYNLCLFEEVDGHRVLLCSCECNPLYFDDWEES